MRPIDGDFGDATIVCCFIFDIRIFLDGCPLCAHVDYFNGASVNGKLKMHRVSGGVFVMGKSFFLFYVMAFCVTS